MVYNDPIAYQLQRTLDRHAHVLEGAPLTGEQLLENLTRLASAIWRSHDQPPVLPDVAQIESILALGPRLETFLDLSAQLGWLARDQEGRYRFQDADVCGYLCARALISSLDSDSASRPGVRDRAVRTLTAIGPPAVPLLLDALGDDDDAVNLAIAVALRNMRPGVAPALVKTLRGGNRKLRRWITEALATRDNADAALPELLAILANDDQLLVRAGAVIALGKSRSSEAEDGLIQALRDDDTMIRSLAAEQLGEFGTARARRALEQHERKALPEPETQSAETPTFHAPRVFLSYPREDAEHVNEVRRLLKLAGFDPWIDSEQLLAGEGWESRLAAALQSSDFVLAFLSRHSSDGYQLRELQMALECVPPARATEVPFVLPCTIDTALFASGGQGIPDFLRQSHALRLSNVEKDWEVLHTTLSQWTRSLGLPVPVLLRSTPIHDLDRAAASRMIIAKNFFSNEVNPGGRAASPVLRAGSLLVEDPITGRMWTRRCIDDLPESPLPTLEDELAELDPRTQEQAAAKVRAAAMRMNSAIRAWIDRANAEQLGGYGDWRLPTLEEAMSLVTANPQRGLHIDALFSTHQYARTADHSLHAFGIGGAAANGYRTVWVVDYADAILFEIPEQAAVPFRLVRSVWKA